VNNPTIQRFNQRLAANDLARTKLSFRIVGGHAHEPGVAPRPPADEVLAIDGGGAAQLRSAGGVVAHAALPTTQTARLFAGMRSSLPALVLRSEARFVPDSVVGEITIEVDDLRAQVYFLIDDAADDLADLHSMLTEIRAAVRPGG
jgi:hypothetical protein